MYFPSTWFCCSIFCPFASCNILFSCHIFSLTRYILDNFIAIQRYALKFQYAPPELPQIAGSPIYQLPSSFLTLHCQPVPKWVPVKPLGLFWLYPLVTTAIDKPTRPSTGQTHPPPFSEIVYPWIQRLFIMIMTQPSKFNMQLQCRKSVKPLTLNGRNNIKEHENVLKPRP